MYIFNLSIEQSSLTADLILITEEFNHNNSIDTELLQNFLSFAWKKFDSRS